MCVCFIFPVEPNPYIHPFSQKRRECTFLAIVTAFSYGYKREWNICKVHFLRTCFLVCTYLASARLESRDAHICNLETLWLKSFGIVLCMVKNGVGELQLSFSLPFVCNFCKWKLKCNF